MIEGEFAVQAHERIVFGTPAGRAVEAEARRAGAKRVFVVTNRSLANLRDGPVQWIERDLGSLHAGTFAGMSAHSSCTDIAAAANEARHAAADLLVAVGGGSVIDGTKAALLCLWRGIKDASGLAQLSPGSQERPEAQDQAPRMIAVPTTFSAAEFTCQSGITDNASRTKRVISHRLFAAQCVVLDSQATLFTPMHLLLATGMRAVDHAVETWCSPQANPVTEVLSMQGWKLLSSALPLIMRDPDDLDARQRAQFGMWQAVWPVAAGVTVGASHGIGYVLGGTYGVPHGETSCVLLPAVLRWNAQMNRSRQQQLSRAVGENEGDLAAVVSSLVASLELPLTLRAVGIEQGMLDDIAHRALQYSSVALNPRPLCTATDVRGILELAF